MTKHDLRSRLGRRTLLISTVALTSLALVAPSWAHPGPSNGYHQAVPAPPANPTSDNQIQNLDQVETAIEAYYGDTVTTTLDPVNGTTPLHQYSPTGAYARQVQRITAGAETYLARAVHRFNGRQSHSGPAKPAIVLDVDDTTLNTYSYEIWSSFVYNPTTNADFVNAASPTVFPAVPGMTKLVTEAQSEGYTIFYLTGRPTSQEGATVTNLQADGYPTINTADVYLKDLSDPWLSSCAPNCTTDQYKSLTRKHIESLGYNIVGNFGDQYSDLSYGYADADFKMPNPMYFLP